MLNLCHHCLKLLQVHYIHLHALEGEPLERLPNLWKDLPLGLIAVLFSAFLSVHGLFCSQANEHDI